MTKQKVRLASFVRPDRYEIILKPDLKGFTFEGEETVTLNLDKPAKEITLHAKELKISKAVFEAASGKQMSGKIRYDKAAETATFTFKQSLPKGQGKLRLVFKGVLNDKMRGFYRSRYSHEGKEKHLATSQFEPTDARRAIPSFDEPAHKAVFDVTLMIPRGTVAISNTIETEVAEHESGYQIVKFEPTPKMSTYLLAFIVGEFEWVEGRTKNNVLVRVFTTPGKKHQAKFALECAIRSLEFYDEYFDIPYPLPVMDLIAIPDFESAAMENWGAITYRESAILVDPEHTSAANKEWVAIVIAHEIAHQWFGNLVTMEWWTHLWLNEGFASYMEHLAVDHLFPEWNLWERFVTDRFSHAMRLDALASTHPIEVEVHHPSEIGEIFDAVSYSKGASVIRMLAEYLGPKNFRDGLRYYLKKHAYGNAITEHLWDALEKVSQKPVRQIMKNWTSKPGFPAVKVLDAGSKLELLQSRFLSSELSQKQLKDKTVWQIPVSFITDKDPKPKKDLITEKEKDITKPKGAKWIKLNAGQTSLFRTNYPPEMLKALAEPIRKKQLATADRIGILADSFALAEAGQMPTIEALKIAESYKNEEDYNVISELAVGLARIDNLIHEEKYYHQFREYGKNIFTPLAEKLGWEKKKGESHSQGLLRSLVLYQAGYFGNLDVIGKAQELFAKGNVPADLRGAVYGLVAENGKRKEFEEFARRYKSETLHEEQERLGRALGHFNNVELLEKALQFVMSGNVRPQDKPFVLAGVWYNDHGRELAWEFVRKNWNEFLKMYSGTGHMMERLIQPAGVLTQGEKAEEILKFFKTHKAPGLDRTIQQVVERIRSNALWLSRERRHIGDWLEQLKD